ncbi:MAG: hypothetical protein DWQ34_12085 [Planctomycetota bacterium]|nr:MAG: hypothetical protein DWQ29_08790 [Planctomycetota bacterium]REJ92933.1 MAG: hypothetical protein DWQ34_12085 [Planctomycetota bacterium]REK26137.1 MAG: hypothetical protein DWQ41_10805 [Planctomycetota bacterium]REK33507.1 MAG: hypothetical protein DWQ45_15075 [Planctomycetota bacterium]
MFLGCIRLTLDMDWASQKSERARIKRRQWLWGWAAGVTVLTEAVTLQLRFGQGRTAVEFNKTAPLLLQIHHMFWAVPLFMLLPLCWRKPRLSGSLLGIGIGFILSDLAHHFARANCSTMCPRRTVCGLSTPRFRETDRRHSFATRSILPLLCGHTGWHWP